MTVMEVAASHEDYSNFLDMENYDYNVQQNIDKKMSEIGMVPAVRRAAASYNACDDVSKSSECVRSMEYLQRIVKSLLTQMNVQSHVFGPGEAITIDLQAEINYDDYIVLTKFVNTKQESDRLLYRIDDIMSNFIHVVEHQPSKFEFVESIINFPAFKTLKFWIVLLTSMVICSLIVVLFVKFFYSPLVHVQLIYGFLIVFIVSCVWTYSMLYEGKRAEAMTHLIQSGGIRPKDCYPQTFSAFYQIWYFVRTSVFNYRDHCQEYNKNTETDPFWQVNPMQAISQSVAFFMFEPLGYIGQKVGSFYYGFIQDAPLLYQPVLLALGIFLTVIAFYGPFRIKTPILTIEPVWRPQFPTIERVAQDFRAISHDRLRNEIMERPDGPVVKSVKNAFTDMDGFSEYLTDDGTNEIEIIGPFARFNLEEIKEDKPSPFHSTLAAPTLDNNAEKMQHTTQNSSPVIKTEEAIKLDSFPEFSITHTDEIDSKETSSSFNNNNPVLTIITDSTTEDEAEVENEICLSVADLILIEDEINSSNLVP